MGNHEYGIDPDVLNQYIIEIKEIVEMGTQVAIVIGGGNIFRGLAGVSSGFDRVKGDYMGMMATIINSLALQSAFQSNGVKATLFTAFKMEPVGEGFSKDKAMEAFEKGHVVIVAGGTGNPYFTTDTASALRAVELEVDVYLKGTRVDGVYTTDPEKDKNATKFDEITFDEVYEKELKVMDLTAFTMCMQNNMPLLVFDMNQKGNLKKIMLGEKIGTLVKK